jgi:hypothetical protein
MTRCIAGNWRINNACIQTGCVGKKSSKAGNNNMSKNWLANGKTRGDFHNKHTGKITMPSPVHQHTPTYTNLDQHTSLFDAFAAFYKELSYSHAN